MSKITLGAQLFTCREFTKDISGVVETFRKVRQIGYETVQISGFGDVDPGDVAKALKDEGLKCVVTHMGWNSFLEDLDNVIETHRIWDCTHTAIGGLSGEYRSAEGLHRFVDELKPVAEKLAEAGMDFSYHNHNHELAKFDGRTWLEQLYELAPPEMLKAEIDTYWIVAGGGDPVKWIRDLAGREPVIHFKDMIVTPEREQRFAEIGEGNLNWPEIIRASEDGGVEYALIEQDNTYGKDPFECLRISYDNLTNSLMKGL